MGEETMIGGHGSRVLFGALCRAMRPTLHCNAFEVL